MTHIRVTKSIGPFVKRERGLLLHETDEGVYMKGMYMVGPECLTRNLDGTVGPGTVVHGPIPREFIDEYVPGPPERTLTEIVGEFWERRGK